MDGSKMIYPNLTKIPFEVEPESIRRNRMFNTNPDTRTRRTFLTIIAALCNELSIDYKNRGTANKVAKMTEEIGCPVSDDTVP